MIKKTKILDIHDKLLMLQIINYRKKGYTNIKVNHLNYLYGLPEEIGGYVPDLSAVLNHKAVICRIVTNDSINDANNIHQWRIFSNSSCEFHIIVPKSFLYEAKDLAKSNGITVDKYWYSNC